MLLFDDDYNDFPIRNLQNAAYYCVKLWDGCKSSMISCTSSELPPESSARENPDTQDAQKKITQSHTQKFISAPICAANFLPVLLLSAHL